MKSLRCVFLLIYLSVLAGCGQKGDLYFPDQKTATSVAPEVMSKLERYGFF